MTDSMAALRKPPCSSARTPAMVVPPGEQTHIHFSRKRPEDILHHYADINHKQAQLR